MGKRSEQLAKETHDQPQQTGKKTKRKRWRVCERKRRMERQKREKENSRERGGNENQTHEVSRTRRELGK